MTDNAKTIRNIAYASMIAAIYAVLVLIFQPLSFGMVQVRVAEMLTILPVFTPAAIPGLAAGCFLSNILSGAEVFDVIFGTFATLIGACGTYLLREKKYMCVLPPIVSNAVIIPFVIRFAYGSDQPIIIIAAVILAGEVLSCGVLGMAFRKVFEKYRKYIFK